MSDSDDVDAEADREAADAAEDFRERISRVFTDDIETGVVMGGSMDLENLNLTATYTLRGFERVWNEAKQEIDDLPDWATNEDAHGKQNLAKHIVRQQVSDQFGIKTDNLSVEMGVDVRNDDYKVTIVY